MRSGAIAYLFPDGRRTALSNLAPHYFLAAFREDFGLDLLFADEERSLLDGKRPDAFATILVGLSYETSFITFVRWLARQGIPLIARDRRTGVHPLIVAGGVAASLNPSPLLEICDAVLRGEAEAMHDELCGVLDDPEAARRRLASLSYAVSTGRMPSPAWAPARSFAVSSHPLLDRWGNEFGDRVVLELDRGCVGNCRFCAARHLYGPRREADRTRLVAAAEEAFARGKGIALLGTGVESVSYVDDLLERAIAAKRSVSLSSVRMAGFTPEFAARLAAAGVKTVTLAPESMREATRRRIGKPLGDEELFAALSLARKHRFKVKLYLMAGLPDTDPVEEAEATVAFVAETRKRGTKVPLSLSVAPFCPKPGTPFAGRRLMTKREYERFRGIVQRGVGVTAPQVTIEWFSWRESLLQAAAGRFDVETGTRFLLACAETADLREAERRSRVSLEDFAGEAQP